MGEAVTDEGGRMARGAGVWGFPNVVVVSHTNSAFRSRGGLDDAKRGLYTRKRRTGLLSACSAVA
jgi:hypothetical protein